MMSFVFLFILLAIFFVVILIPTFIFSFIRTLLSMLGFMFTGRRRRTTSSYGKSNSDSGNRYTSNDKHKESASSAPRKKMFDKDDGEYVDFEEIKD